MKGKEVRIGGKQRLKKLENILEKNDEGEERDHRRICRS